MASRCRSPAISTAIKQACEKVGTLYIADEVQTGLMRTGEMWGIDTYGVVPDMLVTGKGLSGGIYPIAAVVVNETAGQWLSEDGFGHMSSFGGAELGCLAAAKVLEICSRPETRSQVHYISAYLGQRPAPGAAPTIRISSPASASAASSWGSNSTMTRVRST